MKYKSPGLARKMTWKSHSFAYVCRATALTKKTLLLPITLSRHRGANPGNPNQKEGIGCCVLGERSRVARERLLWQWIIWRWFNQEESIWGLYDINCGERRCWRWWRWGLARPAEADFLHSPEGRLERHREAGMAPVERSSSASNINYGFRLQSENDNYDPFAETRSKTIAEKEDEYRQKRRRLVISPERADPFADG